MTTLPLVLVADGHDDTRILLKALFELHGFEVIDSRTGTEAVSLTHALWPEVVLLDRDLKPPGNVPIARQMRQAPYRPVILSIGSPPARADDAEAALAEGCDEYLVKPLDARKLVQLVRLRAGCPATDVDFDELPGGLGSV